MSFPSLPRHAVAASLACVLLMSAGLLQAAPKSKEAVLGSGKASGPVMSKAQLKACVAQQDHIRSQNEEMLKAQQDMAAERAEIERSGTALKADLETLDRTSVEAVDGYNLRAAARDKAIDSYETRTPIFNSKVDALKDERAAYAKSCEGRRYLEDDFNELKAGK